MPHTAESALRNTARALVEVSKAQDKKRRRPVMTWEVREIARLYAEEKISIDEMEVRLQRPKLTIYGYLRTLNIERRRPPPDSRKAVAGFRVAGE